MNELTINLNSKLHIPLYEQIYQYIKGEIRSGNIARGEKLPSSRALANHLEISRSTVEMAYEQLLSEGYIETIPCKGVYVSDVEGLYHQPLDMESVKMTLVLSDGTIEKKTASSDLSMNIYALLLPYLKNN